MALIAQRQAEGLETHDCSHQPVRFGTTSYDYRGLWTFEPFAARVRNTVRETVWCISRALSLEADYCAGDARTRTRAVAYRHELRLVCRRLGYLRYLVRRTVRFPVRKPSVLTAQQKVSGENTKARLNTGRRHPKVFDTAR